MHHVYDSSRTEQKERIQRGCGAVRRLRQRPLARLVWKGKAPPPSLNPPPPPSPQHTNRSSGPQTPSPSQAPRTRGARLSLGRASARPGAHSDQARWRCQAIPARGGASPMRGAGAGDRQRAARTVGGSGPNRRRAYGAEKGWPPGRATLSSTDQGGHGAVGRELTDNPPQPIENPYERSVMQNAPQHTAPPLKQASSLKVRTRAVPVTPFKQGQAKSVGPNLSGCVRIGAKVMPGTAHTPSVPQAHGKHTRTYPPPSGPHTTAPP
jgi:hypothetical protein